MLTRRSDTMLKGIDISHHNDWQYNKGDLNLDKQDFVIMKATEGTAYKDPMLETYMNDVCRYEKPYGFYHYARPENNRAVDEARHFCDVVGTDGHGGIMVLDWEGKALQYDLQWALEFLKYVEYKYGHKPLIYTGSWYSKNLKPIYENGNKLWLAHWTTAKQPKFQVYKEYTIWQYTSKPYDKDIFNGNTNDWYNLIR